MDGEDFESFSINRDYAKKYEEKKRREELSKLRDRYGDDYEPESSSSEEEDDDAQALTPNKERDFLRTLSLLIGKDPSVYDPSRRFYEEDEDEDEDEDENGSGAAKSKKAVDDAPPKKSKPVYLRDYEMQQLKERGSKAFVSDSDDDDSDLERKKAAENNPMLYNQEMRDLKKGFINQLDGINNDDDNDDDKDGKDGTDDCTVGRVLAPRQKDKKSEAKFENAYMKFVQDQDMEGEGQLEEQIKKDLEPLRDIWRDPNLDDDERFLRDYILNHGYMDKESDDVPAYEELYADDEEDEEAVNEQEQFERKYNFRFQEPDAEFIKRYPRTTASVRKPDDSRREKRKAREERRQLEKEEQEAELKRLKRLKRKEIQKKLYEIEAITGVGVDVDKIDLDGDFDATKYDQAMQNAFGSDFYAVEDEEKPIFSDLEDGSEEDDASEASEVAAGTCDAHAVVEHGGEEHGGEEYGGEEYGGEGDGGEGDDDFNMDADFDASATKSKKQQKRERRRRGHAGADAAELPTFDPNEKSIQEYVDEYFKLDYEEMIGDTKCRFKYREVLPNSFGLSTEEVLTCEDRELNSWVSLKKSVQYRPDEEEKMDLRKYKKRAREGKRKRRILASLYKPPTEEEEEGSAAVAAVTAPPLSVPTPTGKRKRDGPQPDASDVKEIVDGIAAKSKSETGKQKKAKKHAQYKQPDPASSVADSRKALFGIDPNRSNRQRRKKKRKPAAGESQCS